MNLAAALLRYTQRYLTTRAQAEYVLRVSNNTEAQSALIIGSGFFHYFLLIL